MTHNHDKDEEKQQHEHDVAVAVFTPEKVYPDDHDFRRIPKTETIKHVLKLAAEKLDIKNTDGWVVLIRGEEVDPDHSFKHLHLSGIVEILWHKGEGGGGNA